MTVQYVPIPDTMIGFNKRELRLLRNLLDEAIEAARRSLCATKRWTERMEQYVDLLADVSEKLGS